MATLINGNGNLAIYAQQDADWYAALMGGQTVITAVGNQFAYELLASNTIGVKDGVIITSEGRRIQLDANAIDSFDIPTGAQGTTNYYIIGYHLVTGNQSEQTCETFVQLMENGTDTIPEGSFRDGDDEVFVSLYRIEQDDLTIGTITLLLPQLSGSFQSQISELNNDLTYLNKIGYKVILNTPITSGGNYELSESMEHFDFLLIESSRANNTAWRTDLIPIYSFKDGNEWDIDTNSSADNYFIAFNYVDNTHIKVKGLLNQYIKKIYGVVLPLHI